ncbi:VanZ family protein [Thalassotalea psychrophila]|uniref:VanZ family protein n=1 Tax=Thalassotalea psychrophila TaxID=3065647 RepID=A0ABY9TSA8_9GAMM|nr:VanZ family protein [Colwelliaceae bacterium SQ149]
MNISNFRIYLLIVIIFSLLAVNYTFITKILYQYHLLDKTGHFFGFFLLTWLVNSLIKIDLKLIIITLCVYAGLTEVGQSYLGFRSGQFTDFIADVLGCLTYVLIVIANKNKAKKERV